MEDTDIFEQLEELKVQFSSSDISITEKVLKLKEFVKRVKSDESSFSGDELDNLLLTICASDFTSKRLRLELANELRRQVWIVDALKMEEKHLVRRALSFSWIFQEGRSDISDTDLLKRSILPIVSYTTRIRIIKELGLHLKNEELSQQIFLDVQETYGSSCAVEMLNACGSEFVQEKLIDGFNSQRLMVSDKVLRQIAMKDCQIALNYIKVIFREIRDKLFDHKKLIQRRKNGYNLTLKYLWLSKPKEVWKLYELFDASILPKMTWQAAKKLLKTERKLVTDAKKFAQLLSIKRRRHVAKYMRSMFQQFFTALFPEDMAHFPDEIPSLFQWLQGFPRVKKFTILNSGFRDNYRCDLLGVPEIITQEIMEILPVGHREQVASRKLEAGDVTKFGGDPDNELSKRYMMAYWYSFKSTKKSVPQLKQILLEEIDMSLRAEVAQLLVYTCYINDRDVESLTSVCRIISSKWVHGHTAIRERFLKAIDENFGFRKLRSNFVWEALEEFIRLARSNYEAVSKKLLEGIIEYHLITHQPIDIFLNELMSKEFTSKYGPPDWDFLKHDPILHKDFLRTVTELICSQFPWEEHSMMIENETHWNRLGMVSLCETMAKWNHRNKKLAKMERLSVTEFPWLVCRLREILMTNYVDSLTCHVHHQKRVVDAVKSDPEVRTGYYKEFIDLCPLSPILEHFLRTDPREIRYHIGTIVPFMLKLDEKLFKSYKGLLVLIKTQGFPQYQAAIVEACLETAQDDSASWTERRNAIIVLSYLWDAKSYLNTVSLFYPEDADTIILGDSTLIDYRIRIAVVQSLAQVSSGSNYVTDAFASVLKFCVFEDYLSASVGPLASLCKHAPTREAIKFLKESLLDRDIPIKLHTIRLICAISDRSQDYEELLVYLWENETHHTIKERVLEEMYKFLGDRPTADNWGVLKGAIQTLTPDDKELLSKVLSLSNVINISSDFLPDFILTCLEKFPDLATRVGTRQEVEFKAGAFEIAARLVNYLPAEFIDHLIHQYLFEIKEPEIVQQKVINLAVAYCLKLNSNLPRFGAVLMEAFSKLKPQDKWNYSRQGRRMVDRWCRAPSTNFPSRQSLFTFVSTLCDQSFKKLSVHGTPLLTAADAKDTYKFIGEVIESYFSKQDTFTDWFYLRCARIFSPVQFHFAINEGKVRTKDSREEGFRLLSDAGARFQRLVDDQVKSYGPYVLGFINLKLASFFKDILKQEESLLQEERVIYFIDGLLKSISFGENGLKNGVSQANQILAIELMPSTAPQSMHFKRKFAECQDSLTRMCGRTTRIFLSDSYSTRF